MAQQKGPGLGKKVGKIGMWILLAAIAWALLQRFDLDPFAVIGWIWTKVWALINAIADAILGNDTFRDVTEAPGISNIISFLKF